MTSWLSRLLDEETVYWPPPKNNGKGGFIWEFPIQVLTRWQYSRRRTTGPEARYLVSGTKLIMNTSVWSEYDFQPGGYLWKGTLKELQTIFDPDPVYALEGYEVNVYNLASQIMSVEKIRAVSSRIIALRKAYLDKS